MGDGNMYHGMHGRVNTKCKGGGEFPISRHQTVSGGLISPFCASTYRSTQTYHTQREREIGRIPVPE